MGKGKLKNDIKKGYSKYFDGDDRELAGDGGNSQKTKKISSIVVQHN